jgi:hypothetical protein
MPAAPAMYTRVTISYPQLAARIAIATIIVLIVVTLAVRLVMHHVNRRPPPH